MEPTGNTEPAASGQDFLVKALGVSRPKGGCAIRGIGEEFAANPVTGSASFSIPLLASPGRNGSGPQLTLSCDSGSGKGTFGCGCALALSAIVIKTDKGLPRHSDLTDTFLISGAEDLVPVLTQEGAIEDDFNTDADHVVRRDRPRIEGLFARIERWTQKATREVHWRSITSDNVLSIGLDRRSRTSDRADPTRISSWLICQSLDDKGNGIIYEYEAEDGEALDLTAAHEQDRGAKDDLSRTAQQYISRIRYGNASTLLTGNPRRRPGFLSDAVIAAMRLHAVAAIDLTR